MFLLIIALILLILVFNYKRNGSKYPPGPFGFPLVGVLPFLGPSPQVTMTNYGKKYGKIFSLQLGSFNVVVLNDFNLIKNCLRQEAYSGRPKDKMLMLTLMPNAIVYNEGPEMQEMRRFTMKNLRDFGWGKKEMNEMMLEEVEGLVNYLKNQNGKPLEIKCILDIAILNSVAHLVVGKRYRLDDKKIIEMNKIGQEGFMEPAVAGTVYFLPWIAKIFPTWSKLKDCYRGQDYYNEYFTATYQEHKDSFDPNYCRDLADCFLKEEAEAKDPAQSYFCREKGFRNFIELLQNLFLGGSDTSSTTISWSIIYLLHNPEVLKKIQHEIDTIVGRSRLPTGKDRPQMPYTEATMWEIMRMSSIVPGALLHSTMEDVEVEGYNLPKRTIILPNLHHVHTDKEYWGDPEIFRPERFIMADGTFKKDERVIPFSIGKRVCIAESLAQTTVFMFLTGMLQNFNIVLPPGHPLPPLDGKYGLIVNTKPYKVLFEPR